MDIVLERGTFFIISALPGMRRCDVVFEAIATNWLKWLQRAGGWPRSSRPSPRARPTFSLSGLGHTSCLAATSLSPNLHPPLSLSPPFFGTVSAAEPARIPWPQFQSQGHLSLFQVRLQARDRRFVTSSFYLSCCLRQISPQYSSNPSGNWGSLGVPCALHKIATHLSTAKESRDGGK